MRQVIKLFLWVVLLACGLQAAWGFSLIGPGIGGGVLGDAWEQPVIGYGLAGDVGTPKNIGEEYRRNTPVMYYALNENFSGFFGADGEAAVTNAFAIMNNLTNMTSYSPSLSEFPLDSQHINFTATSLGLTDLKSLTLNLLVEQMGLAQPERYIWTLHDRYLPGGGKCPLDEVYLVVQRNFDITTSPLNQLQYSPFVNGTLYSYLIDEFCTTAASPDPPMLAETVPFSVDPFADIYTSVASLTLDTGSYYSGLTRDDVGGLRYLLQTNNVNYETAAAGSDAIITNIVSQPVLLTTSNLTTLFLSAQTNDPVTLAGLFPGLIVASSSNSFVVVNVPNIVSYVTNFNGSTAPTFVVATNGFTQVAETIFVDTFANVITNGNFTNNFAITRYSTNLMLSYSPNTPAASVTTAIGQKIGAPIGTVATNITSKSIILTNVPSGEYFLIPPGQCGWNILSTLLTNVVITTNVITEAANANGFIDTESIVTRFTNHTFVAQPIICTSTPSPTNLYQGINQIQFVRVPDLNLDPLTGNFLQPITNNYTMVYVNPTNSQAVVQHFQRVVTAPDILFSAEDLATGPSDIPVVSDAARNLNFDQGTVLPGLAGPGVINPQTTITFDKVGPIFANGSLALFGLNTNQFLGELDQGSLFGLGNDQSVLAFASFDGSTNDPIVYPNGTSIENLENQILIQISPPSLPDGTNDVAYATTTFTATGGQPPYTWSLASGSDPLPTGLTLASDGTLSGTPTGNPSGTYDFTLELDDSSGRTVQLNYSINIQ
jgi:hypothetical protein